MLSPIFKISGTAFALQHAGGVYHLIQNTNQLMSGGSDDATLEPMGSPTAPSCLGVRFYLSRLSEAIFHCRPQSICRHAAGHWYAVTRCHGMDRGHHRGGGWSGLNPGRAG